MDHVKYVTLVNYLLTFVFGITGNTLVLYVVAKYPPNRKDGKRNIFNCYIWNLALADELFILTIPFFCYATFTNNWLFGEIVCKMAWVVHECNKFAAVFTLSVLSICRSLQVVMPLGKTNPLNTMRSAVIVCGFIWFLSMTLASPYGIYARVVSSPVLSNQVRSGVGGSFARNTSMDLISKDHILQMDHATTINLTPTREEFSEFNEDNVQKAVAEAHNYSSSSNNVISDRNACIYRFPDEMKTFWIYFEVTVGLIVPIVIIAISNIQVLYTTHKVASQLSARRRTSPAEESAASNNLQPSENTGLTRGNNADNSLRALTAPDHSIAPNTGHGYRLNVPGQVTNRRSRDQPIVIRRRRQGREMTRLLLVMIILFFICHTPFYAFHITSKVLMEKLRAADLEYRNAFKAEYKALFIHLNVFVQMLVFFSSCCNPILYGVMNRNYRARYKQVLFCCTDLITTGLRAPSSLGDDTNPSSTLGRQQRLPQPSPSTMPASSGAPYRICDTNVRLITEL